MVTKIKVWRVGLELAVIGVVAGELVDRGTIAWHYAGKISASVFLIGVIVWAWGFFSAIKPRALCWAGRLFFGGAAAAMLSAVLICPINRFPTNALIALPLLGAGLVMFTAAQAAEEEREQRRE